MVVCGGVWWFVVVCEYQSSSKKLSFWDFWEFGIVEWFGGPEVAPQLVTLALHKLNL